MSDKPTGVFVRLPLSEEAASVMRNHIMSQILTADALAHTLLAIGTPVTGGDLYPVGYINEDAIGGLATGIYSSASIFREKDAEHYDIVSLIRQSDAQSQIAALEAEVVRLREALEGIENANNNLCFMRSNDTYQSMIRDGCKDLLVKLNDARCAAREALKGGAA